MQKPTFEVNTLKEDSHYGQFAIEPLENGFGHTLGNALRRVLLSSFKGAAITQTKVKGVTHKFSTLEGLSEDMIDLILNLKGVKVAYEGEEPVTAKLKVSGPKSVTAKDITAPASVSVVNPEAPIARLAKGATLEMELEIATGYGYSPSEDRSSDTIGVIPLDAIFSPVERVSYQVQSTRVGRRTDYDKLVLDIYTDGSRSPSEVLKEASQVLAEYFTQIYHPTLSPVKDSSGEPKTEVTISLEELGLPTRITNALKNADYESANELADASDKDLKNVKNLGDKSIELVDQALEGKGLKRTE
jgi:DNA-directed RNA polymerase subunit alpha